MRVLKDRYLNEYQKCGEIMVSVNNNKFSMACSFCSDSFTQLQSFMRHLQLQHDNKLAFAREVEVYAVEELLNQTIASSVVDGENEDEAFLGEDSDTNWLNDMKWLEEEEKKDLEVSARVNCKDNGLDNMSILKALKDCDVSFNLLENIDTTMCDASEVEENDLLGSTSLREIQKDWEECDHITESRTNQIASIGKTAANDNKDTEAEKTLKTEDSFSPKDNKKDKDSYKKSSAKGLKNLLEGLDDLEDVDCLLENLEDSVMKAEDSLNSSMKNQDFLDCLKQLEVDIDNDINSVSKELDSTTKLTLQKITIPQEPVGNNKNIAEGEVTPKNCSPVKRIINKIPKSKANQTFEYKIKNLKTMLDEETTNKDKDIDIILADESKLGNKEELLNTENLTLNIPLENLNQQSNLETNSENLPENCNMKLKNSEEFVNTEVLNELSISNALNEDLKKALADALDDEGEDLQPDEILNHELINLLNQELNEKDIQTSETISASKTVSNFTVSKVCYPLPDSLKAHDKISLKISEKTNPSEDLNSKASISIKMKYKKTNLKANKILNNKCNVLTQPLECMVSIAKNQISSESKQICVNEANAKIIKGDHEVFKEQKLYQAMVNKPQTPQKLQNHNNKQRKTPSKVNKENSSPLLNIGRIKKEKLTPHTNFVNTQRGERTPLKAEHMFLKQNSKSQEKYEERYLQLKTTPKIKLQEMQTNINDQERATTQNKLKNTTELPKTQTNPFNQETTAHIKQKNTPQTQKIKVSPKYQQSNNSNSPANCNQKNLSTSQIKQQKTLQATECKPFEKSPQLQEKLVLKNQDDLYIKRRKTPPNQKAKSKENKDFSSPETPVTVKKKIEVKIVKKSSPLENKPQINKRSLLTPSKENKSIICNPLKTPLTTPQRIKKLSIKLPRFTPEKLIQTNQKRKTTSFNQTLLTTKANSPETEINGILSAFKLPEGITITKVANKDGNTTQSQPQEIVETPVKKGYCKQNFSESSLLAKPNVFTGKLNTKTKSIGSKIRQRKVSLDTLPANTEPTSKTPRHSNLDYKSYAVSRTARKKQILQRMRHIKKQIFKSIASDNCTVTQVNQTKSPPMKHHQRNKIQVENVQILPKLKEEILTPLIDPSNNLKTSSDLPSVSPNNMDDDQKQAKKSLENPDMCCPINDDEKLFKKSLKRTASSPLLAEENPSKRSCSFAIKQQKQTSASPVNSIEMEKKSSSKPNSKSSLKQQNNTETNTNNLEATQLNLSESVLDFLQRDLKANHLNVESFLNDDLPSDDITPDETSLESNAKDSKSEGNQKFVDNNCDLIDDLLQQVDNEQKSVNKTETDLENKSKSDEIVDDFNEAKDIELLEKFGLKIIKVPDIEEVISLEELEAMNEKAQKFADFYKLWPRIWSSKPSVENVAVKEVLKTSCQNMLTEMNSTFNLNLNVSELKRLINLISFWYVYNFNGKLIEKKKISESMNRYLHMFHYIPKTARRIYYCEYCPEYYNTENKYFNHRTRHTGALFPFKCQKCLAGYKMFRALKLHESTCSGNKFQCKVCLQYFESSDMLYQHSKKHLKTVYNCTKCELVFASALDVQNHMAICNKSTKYIPKQYTPRPSRQKN